MKILVCFKTGPDLEKVVEPDWQGFTPETDLAYAGRVLGCFDESALEIALRLKESGDGVECHAVTVGPVPPSAVWQALYAAGFDRVAVIEAEDCEFRSSWVARTLADFAGKGGYDLILTGRQAGLADTATVPFLLAEGLGIPVVGEVEAACWAGEHLSLERATDLGRERLTVRLPIVAAVGNSPVAALRAVTLKARLAAAKRAVERLAPATRLEAGQRPALRREAARTNCRFLPGEDLAALAGQITAEYLGGGRT